MRSQGPRPRTDAGEYTVLARDAVDNPDVWFEHQIREGDVGTANRLSYAIAALLCDITQREGVLYVRYNGGAISPESSNTEEQP